MRGDRKQTAISHLPDLSSAGVGTFSVISFQQSIVSDWSLDPDYGELEEGCRGFTGPVPQPLWMSTERIELSAQFIISDKDCQFLYT